MAEKALEFIREAEEKSKRLIEQANADAAKMVESAVKKVELDIIEQEELSLAQLARMREEASARALEQQHAFDEETNGMAAALRKKLDEKKDKAVDVVLETIMSS